MPRQRVRLRARNLPLTGFVPVDPDLYLVSSRYLIHFVRRYWLYSKVAFDSCRNQLYLVSSRYFEIGLSFRHDQIALGSQLLGSESMIQT